ncbi:MAG TPA: hypothetical protein VGG39_08770 [Polyangiaceae bacterium]|jgi:hypothetical protein
MLPVLATDPRVAEFEATARASLDAFSEGASALARAAQMMIDAAASAANQRPADAATSVQMLGQLAQTLDACRIAVEPLLVPIRALGLLDPPAVQA